MIWQGTEEDSEGSESASGRDSSEVNFKNYKYF